ncbi:hypothetical protein [Pleomorphomonas sp. JP5]|uniref:hypothetical protein n=1 Tax=Pleomorphomonas sp. JP5 TaxID=2942998 RepID=UPI002042C240|nr:hypothetical protein [Pleomorphomonas sp. JP5]MCM5559926.1 hypothetical protein [Pleomorphomonas sp. JP5]
MIRTAMATVPIDPENVWSVANGRIKLVDLTSDMLADFETYKREAEADQGTANDSAQTGSTTGNKVIYAFRFTDMDPASWLPQWNEPGSNQSGASVPGHSGADAFRERLDTLLSVNDESSQEDIMRSRRVFNQWLAERYRASHTDDSEPTNTASSRGADHL